MHRRTNTTRCRNNSNLHIGLYESDIAFMDYLKNNKKTMWLYAQNAEKELKNQEILVYTLKK
jgi:hypothetical protein